MVPRPSASASVALMGLVSWIAKVSFGSNVRSPFTFTTIVFRDWPGAKLSVLVRAAKSEGALAVPASVANPTVTVFVEGVESLTEKTNAAVVPESPSARETSSMRRLGWAAFTRTLNVRGALLLPRESLEVQLTAVSPTGNNAPVAGEQVTATVPSTRSKAVGVAYVTGAPAGLVAVTVMSAGTPASVGGVVSVTVTVNEADAVLPLESVAVHVTVVAPSANVEPEGGRHETGTGPSTRSYAVGLG